MLKLNINDGLFHWLCAGQVDRRTGAIFKLVNLFVNNDRRVEMEMRRGRIRPLSEFDFFGLGL